MNVEEKAKEYAEKTCAEELKTKYIPDYDLTIYEACELDFKNGYEQALKDINYHEMLSKLKRVIELRDLIEMDSTIVNEGNICEANSLSILIQDIEKILKNTK